MWRFVRRVLIGASLLLCLATLSLWVRSYFIGDSIDRFRRNAAGAGTYHDTFGAFSTYGSFGVGYLRLYHPTTQDWPGDPRWRFNTTPASRVMWEHRWWVLGFGYWNTLLPPGPAHSGIHPIGFRFPHWFVALLFGLAPAAAARRCWLDRHRRRRLRAGLCVHCGYDLRAGGQQCPECGAFCSIPSPLAGEG